MKFVRIDYSSGAVDMSTLREGPPVGVENGPSGYVIAKGNRSFRWIEVGSNTLSPWQQNGQWPATVDPDVASVKPLLLTRSLEEWKAKRNGDLRDEASRRITVIMPEYKQLNALARATELTNKLASGQALTTGEAAEVEFFKAIWADQINPIRTASNVAGDAVDAAADHDAVEAAFAGVVWPA